MLSAIARKLRQRELTRRTVVRVIRRFSAEPSAITRARRPWRGWLAALASLPEQMYRRLQGCIVDVTVLFLLLRHGAMSINAKCPFAGGGGSGGGSDSLVEQHLVRRHAAWGWGPQGNAMLGRQHDDWWDRY